MYVRRPCQHSSYFQFWIILSMQKYLRTCCYVDVKGQHRMTCEKTYIPTAYNLTSTYSLWWWKQQTPHYMSHAVAWDSCHLEASYQWNRVYLHSLMSTGGCARERTMKSSCQYNSTYKLWCWAESKAHVMRIILADKRTMLQHQALFWTMLLLTFYDV